MVKSKKDSYVFSEDDKRLLNELSNKYKKSKKYSNKEINELIKAYRNNNDESILLKILESYYMLLIKKVWKYKTVWIDAQDIVSFGIEAIMDAVKYAYDVDKNVKFITYIYSIIDRRIMDGMDEMYNTIRLPKNVMSKKRKIFHKDNINIHSKICIPSSKQWGSLYNQEFPTEFDNYLEHKFEVDSLRIDLNRIFKVILTNKESSILTYLYGLNEVEQLHIENIASKYDMQVKDLREQINSIIDKLKNNKKAINLLKNYLNLK